MLDAAALIKRGTHSVTIVWDTFERAFRMAARIKGVPDAEYVTTPNRKGSDTPEIQRAKARAMIPELVGKLLVR